MVDDIDLHKSGADRQGQSDLAGSIILNWVAQEPRARFIVDGSMKLAWANEAGVQLLAAGNHFVLDSSNFVMGRGELRTKFEQAIRARALAWIQVIENEQATAGNVVVRCERLTEGNRKPYFGIQVTGQLDSSGDWIGTLTDYFLLTPRQSEVFTNIILGHSLERIAAQMKISVETVRTHTRDIYSKLRVSSREELFVKIRPFYM